MDNEKKIKLEVLLSESDSDNFYVTVRSEGRKLGEITISREAFQWYSYKAQKATTLTWEKFDKVMDVFDQI